MALNYEEDLHINEDALDVEWLDQPKKFMRYAELSAKANERLRKAEEKVKTIRSELALEVTEKGQELIGKAKPTAGDIEAYYRTHLDYIAAKEAVSDIMFEAEMLANAVSAFQQRKTALENLTRLHGQSYFSGPTEPRDLSESYKEQHKERVKTTEKEQTQEKVRSRTSRTRRNRPAKDE